VALPRSASTPRRSTAKVRAEMLARRMTPEPEASQAPPGGGWDDQVPRRTGKEPPSTMEQILKSSVTRTVAREVTRGLLGALFGTPSRRRRGLF
jgi:hypothetical protein